VSRKHLLSRKILWVSVVQVLGFGLILFMLLRCGRESTRTHQAYLDAYERACQAGATGAAMELSKQYISDSRDAQQTLMKTNVAVAGYLIFNSVWLLFVRRSLNSVLNDDGLDSGMS
jgi:hypothetical protein